jgi:hypothetical protein
MDLLVVALAAAALVVGPQVLVLVSVVEHRDSLRREAAVQIGLEASAGEDQLAKA